MASTGLLLPSGFRFHPTDEELVMHYLGRKCAGLPIPIPIIAEVDLYKYNPWQLPGMALYGEEEWYFFSPRDRKYPNGSRPNRAAGAGYWKATGADKAVRVPMTVAIKKALVFYDGKAPGGEKTNWIMHEFRLAGVDPSHPKEQSRRLDEWVLCRIYHKKGASNTPGSSDRKRSVRSFQSPPPSVTIPPNPELPISLALQPVSFEDFFSFNAEESMPRLLADSSCVQEVPSGMNWAELERALDGIGGVDPTAGFLETGGALDPLQDMFMHHRKTGHGT